jgi:hypothetical protein
MIFVCLEDSFLGRFEATWTWSIFGPRVRVVRNCLYGIRTGCRCIYLLGSRFGRKDESGIFAGVVIIVSQSYRLGGSLLWVFLPMAVLLRRTLGTVIPRLLLLLALRPLLLLLSPLELGVSLLLPRRTGTALLDT